MIYIVIFSQINFMKRLLHNANFEKDYVFLCESDL